MNFWKQNICSSQLDVQETDFTFSQFQQKLRQFLLTQAHEWTVSQLWISGIWLERYFIATKTNPIKPRVHQHKETCGIASCRAYERRIKPKAPTKHDSSELFHIDSVPSNIKFSESIAMLYVFEDNEAVIKMIIKGRSPTMRHVSKTHRISLDWLFDRIDWDPKIQIRYIDHQAPDRRHIDKRTLHM